jgi:hypothetical protein
MPKRSVRKAKRSPTKRSPAKRSLSKRSPKTNKKSARKSKVASPRGCVAQTTSKYTSRSSPPYPANECCDRKMTGNDGSMYISKMDKNGICKWIKL